MRAPPAFPIYQGPPLPPTLKPLHPLHWLLLLKWMHFQPSRLKHYLWQAGPELYQAQGPAALRQSVRTRAYRDLFISSVLLTVILSAGLAWLPALALGSAADWKGVLFGALGGLFFGSLFVIVSGLAYGGAFGAMFGTTFGVVFGGTFGLTFGVVYGLVRGSWFGLAGGLAFGVAFGIAFVMAFGMAFGLAGGIRFIVALIAALVAAFGVVLILVGGGAVVLALVVAAAVTVIAGGSRLLPYLFQWWQALLLARSGREPCLALARHPVLWDEYAALPLPGIHQLLRACLAQDLEHGLQMAAQVAANPFQRWAVQRALSDFLAVQKGRLAVIYRIVQSPSLNEYLAIPSRHVQFQQFPPARLVLLGELGQKRVSASSETTGDTESVIWRLTRRQRHMQPTPFSKFCAFVYELLHNEGRLETIDVQEIRLAEQFEPAYEGVRPFRNGPEVASSFSLMDAFLGARSVESVALAHQQLAWMDDVELPLLRPTVVEVLKALGDVSREVSVHQRATSTGQKSAALNRAIGALNELSGYVSAKIAPPERVLLRRVIELWQSIIAAEQGRLGEAALQEMAPSARRAAGIVERTSSAWQRPSRPFDNPYIVGDPVYPPLLVGRKDIFDRIGEVWTAKKNPDSIILYGHRRMGKSSILRNLDQVAPPGSVVVYGDMAGETSFIELTADLLLALADRIYHAVRRSHTGSALPEPDPDDYDTQARAQFQFNRLLHVASDALAGGTLILALDEFEAVERAVQSGKVGKEIYQFLRAKTQEPWLALVFGGLHTLDEMSRDYQQPFYGSYENICVSYLGPKDAWRLIANPTEDFALNYEPVAIERIIAETGGQPYLVQQVCRDALDHLNHQLFDLALQREACITQADVDAVLDDEFFRRGTVYFDGVWTQALNADQRTTLCVLAGRDEPCSLEELAADTGLDEHRLLRQLQWAERHDVLYQVEHGRWAFHVPLMQRWIRSRD